MLSSRQDYRWRPVPRHCPPRSPSCPPKATPRPRAARSAHLAELEVLGLERLLDLGLPAPRRVLLRLRLLRGRGRAGGQAVQHLPDVEFPHGLGGAGPRPGRGGQGRPRAGGASPGGGQLPRGSRRRGGECEGKRRLQRSERESKQEIRRRRESRGRREPWRRPSSSEAAAAASPRGPAAPQWRRRPERSAGLTWPRADPAPRRRPGSPPPPPPCPWPAAPALRPPRPAVPRRCLPLRPPLRLPGVAGSPSAAAARPPRRSAPLPARHRPQGARGGSPRSPPRSASPARHWTVPPSLLRSPAAGLRRPCRPRSRPAAPSRPTGRLGTRHQRPRAAAAPRVQRRRRRRQLGLRGAGLLSMRTPPAPPPPREWSWGLNHPPRKSQTTAQSPRPGRLLEYAAAAPAAGVVKMLTTKKQQEAFLSNSVFNAGFKLSPFKEAHTPGCWLQYYCCCFIDGLCVGLIWIWYLKQSDLTTAMWQEDDRL